MMEIFNDNIGFIGAGNMGQAIIRSLLAAGLFRPEQIFVSDITPDKPRILHEETGTRIAASNREVFTQCRIIMLCVKPPQVTEALAAFSKDAETGAEKLIISVAAGVRLAQMEKTLYNGLSEAIKAKLPIIRVMPNTPALVRKGVSGFSPNRCCGPEHKKIAQTILQAMGAVIEFPEARLDAVTAVSGSGPAYVFYLAEAMIEGGKAAGLKAADARRLTVETIKGAAALMEGSTETPQDLRKKVTSPGGTTQAAVEVMEKADVKEYIIQAVLAASKRAEELSR